MSQLRRVPSVLFRRVGRGVMLAPVDADPFVVTAPGDVVWDLLEQPMSLDELIETLADVFDGDRGKIAADVTALVEGLVAAGVLER